MKLVKITESFIEKNPLQIKKGMQSVIILDNPIEIKYYFNAKKALEKTLDLLINKNGSILILMRNKNDINKYLSNRMIINGNNIEYKNNLIPFLTIHSSKGLESDYIIILNVSNELYGIPNKIENHPILNFLNNNIDKYPYSEERRVFFVALTRCKKKTILLVPFNSPSPFIKEIKHSF